MRVPRTSRGLRAIARFLTLLLCLQATLPVLAVSVEPTAQGNWLDICTAYGIRYIQLPAAASDAADPPVEEHSGKGNLPFVCPLWQVVQPALLLDPPGRAEPVTFAATGAFLPPPADVPPHAGGDPGPPLGARAPPIV